MFRFRCNCQFFFGALATVLAMNANAVVIDFQGSPDIIEVDSGGAVYSGATFFSGSIDVQPDGTFTDGVITDGTTSTAFSCPMFTDPDTCGIAAGSSFSNNVVLDQDSASLLNTLLGTSNFSAGDTVDGVNIEGDANTGNGTRIEAGLSYIFPSDTFADGLSTFADIFPLFDPDDATVALFFILEDDDNLPDDDDDIYSAFGLLDSPPTPEVPLPAAAWLFGSALLGLIAARKRR
ncbi:MAG: VPLPA-CTERM sorting domain-containing protein [Pseudomonadales bacterium]